MDKNELRDLTGRLITVRTRLLSTHPFFGRLLLHMKFGFAECSTAFTDMKRIVFDPEFAKALSDDELRFVMLHEVMHCALHHCTRGRTLRPFLYNVACDIVVNSLIMETLGVSEFTIDGEEAMHRVPNGKEGRLFCAEEVYDMLNKASEKELENILGAGGIDSHSIWEQIEGSFTDDEWDQFVAEAAKRAGSSTGIPNGLKRYLKDITHTPKTNWRQLLHDFIQHDRSDYSYLVPDRRFQDGFILPSFREDMSGECVDRLWFLVDTSGSVSETALAEAFCEIRDALEQIDELSGELSFFDTKVSRPTPFSSVGELLRINPIGGGGTSFEAIFNAMDGFFEDELPRAILIMTDGYAAFPDEDAARGVPVLWIIIDSDVDAPWGECIHIVEE